MTSKRTARKRQSSPNTPQWAVELLNGRIPEKDTPEWDEFVGWKYFDYFEGLPDSRYKKYAILANANKAHQETSTPSSTCGSGGEIIIPRGPVAGFTP